MLVIHSAVREKRGREGGREGGEEGGSKCTYLYNDLVEGGAMLGVEAHVKSVILC